MVRGIAAGALAIGAVYVVQRIVRGMKRDLGRYDAMRRISNQEPLAVELLSALGAVAAKSVPKSGVASLVTSLTGDAVRYARMRTM